MVGNIAKTGNQDDAGHALQDLSIEKACEEYNNSVKLTLTLINHQLDAALAKHYNELEELAVKIAARTNFLEKNPSFLSCLVYNKTDVKSEPLLEFDEIKITLKDHSRRILDKVEEVDRYHRKLFELVVKGGREQKLLEGGREQKLLEGGREQKLLEGGRDLKLPESDRDLGLVQEVHRIREDDDEFQDCLEPKEEVEMKISFEKKSSPPRRRTSQKGSFDKITMQKDAYSDTSVGSTLGEPPIKFQLFPDIQTSPDVQRRKPQEDIHGKLIQQLEATDSLEGFIKLMERRPRTKRQMKAKKNADLEQKYTGSLWFFPKGVKTKISKSSVSSKTPSQKSTKILKGQSCSASTCCNLLVTSSQPVSLSNQERTRRIKQGLGRTKLRCYDLLDDIDGNDVKPIKSEYPRRDNIYPMKLQEAKSYLHRMMQENEKVWKKLLLPIEAKKRHSSEAKKHAVEMKKKQVQTIESKKLKNKSVRNLIEYLTAPQQKFLTHIPQSLIVMPVKIFYDNFPTKDKTESPRGAVLITDLTRTIEAKKPEGKLLRTDAAPRAPDYCKSDPFPIQRKKEMLDQLRGLKMRNDSIQKNIQKAIDVIETKMIDLLSSPVSVGSSEAFNAMEEEITNVLKMMSESEAKEKNQKVEAEKDDNKPATPTLKRGLTTVKKAAFVEVKPGAGDQSTDGQKTKEEVKKDDPKKICREESDNKVSRKVSREESRKGNKEEGERKKTGKDDAERVVKRVVIEEKAKKVPKEEKKKEESEKVTIKVKECPLSDRSRHSRSSKFHYEEVKKAANIEEGERLLGQVDSVIRKIDSIYTKFYDESKSKSAASKQDSNYSNVIEFIDGIKQMVEPPPIRILYKDHEDVSLLFQAASSYCQARVYHPALVESHPPKEEEKADEFVDAKEEREFVEAKEEKKEVVEAKMEAVEEAKKDVVEDAKKEVVEEAKKEVVEEAKKEVVETKKEVVEVKMEVVDVKKEVVEAKKEVVEAKEEVVEVKKELVELKQTSVDERKGLVEAKKEVVEPEKVSVEGGICRVKNEPKKMKEEVVEEAEFIETSEELTEREDVKVTARAQDVVSIVEKRRIEDRRHEFTLRAFYTLFFSSIFIALNFDYTS